MGRALALSAPAAAPVVKKSNPKKSRRAATALLDAAA
jgi:hypothetical protein